MEEYRITPQELITFGVVLVNSGHYASVHSGIIDQDPRRFNHPAASILVKISVALE